MSGRRFRVLVAPDAFKGSCTAPRAAAAIARGLAAAGEYDVRLLPLADGGEGTLEALAVGGRLEARDVETVDAAGRPCRARIGVDPRGVLAVVEAAMAHGLPQVRDLPADPMGRHTEGVGVLLDAAMRTGAEEIVLGVGGSATSDGGVGCLRRLGVDFLDRNRSPISPGAAGLLSLARIDLTRVDPRWSQIVLRVAVDVDNPLLGSRGTAAVFSPQKGAQPDDVTQIEAGLAHLADLIETSTGRDVRDLAGTGASGGLAAGLHGLLGARLESGSALVAEASGLAEAVANADLVITGEGSFDGQSLDGKVVSAVARTVAGRCPVVVLAGRVEVAFDRARRAGITAAFSLARGAATEAQLISEVEPLLEELAAQVAALGVASG